MFQYSATQTENLTKITEPADSGHTAGTTQLTYNDPTNNPNLPTSALIAAGHCTSYLYNIDGDLTDSYTNQTNSGCYTATGNHSHVDYNPNGTVKDW